MGVGNAPLMQEVWSVGLAIVRYVENIEIDFGCLDVEGTHGGRCDKGTSWTSDALTSEGTHVTRVARDRFVPDRLVHGGACAGDV